MKTAILTTALVLSLVVGKAQAQKVPEFLGLNTFSIHSKPGYEHNTFGLYGMWHSGLVAGVLRNSYGKTSVLAAKLYNIDKKHHFGLLMGGVTGYGDTAERLPLAPVIAPTARIGITNSVSARLLVFPDPRQGAAQVLHLTFEFRLR